MNNAVLEARERRLLDRNLRRELLSGQGGEPSPTNALAGIHPDLLAFGPGERTRDNGVLGQPSGRIEIVPHEGSVSAGLSWSLAQNDVEVATTTTAGPTDPIAILAGQAGLYRLTVAQGGRPVGECVISVPQFVRIRADLADMAPVLTACGIPEAHREQSWSDILAVARKVAHHILRPVNCRLLWPGMALPRQFEAGPVAGDGAMLAGTRIAPPDDPEQGFALGLLTVRLLAPVSAVAASTHIGDALTAALRDSVPVQLAELAFGLAVDWAGLSGNANAQSVMERLKGLPDAPVWCFDGTFSRLGVAMVRPGLGQMGFDGGPLIGSDGTLLDIALREVAAAVPAAEWGQEPSAARATFVEAAGRLIGVATARAVLRLIGVQEEDVAAAHLRDVRDGSVVVAGIMATTPDDLLRDCIGFERTDGLHDLAARVNADTAAWRQARHLHGITSKYDVLCGLVSDRSNQAVVARLGLLPPAYGPYRFQPGDNDEAVGGIADAPVYGARHRTGAQAPPRSDMVALIQKDLAATGILTGLVDTNVAVSAANIHALGRYGYRRFETSGDHYDGRLGNAPARESSTASRDDPPAVKEAAKQVAIRNNQQRYAGHTGFAVRELQIAHRYPNLVTERLHGGVNYAERLAVVEAGPAADYTNIDAAIARDPEVDGELDVLWGDDLRNWRFRRRRYPIVVVAGSQNEATPFAAQGNAAAVHNVGHPAHTTETSLRMRVYDLSGYYRADHEPEMLGSYGRYTVYGGPKRRLEDLDDALSFTLENVISEGSDWQLPAAPINPNENKRRQRLHSIYRVMSGVARQESLSNFASSNSYDSASYSCAPFHYTATTGQGSASVLSGFVDWLLDPPNELLQSVYPDFSEPAGWPILPAGYPPQGYPQDQTGVDRLRAELRDRMQAAYAAAFGHFGVGASKSVGTKREGFLTLTGLERCWPMPGSDAGAVVDMTVGWSNAAEGTYPRKRALHQSYVDWFRGWHWMYRLNAAMRTSRDLRTFCFIYSVHYSRAVIAPAAEDVRTEAGRAAVLRVAVRGSLDLTRDNIRTYARGAVATEGARIRTQVDLANPERASQEVNVFSSTIAAMTHNPSDQGINAPDGAQYQDRIITDSEGRNVGVAGADFYHDVRDYMLRTLMHGQATD